MKLSIKVFLFASLLLFIGFNADAQRRGGPPNPEDMAVKQTAHMTEALSLSEDQAVKVEAINLAYAKKMHEAHKANGGDRSAMKEIATAINNEKAAELKMVLTRKQYKAFEKLLAEHPKPRGGKGGGKKGAK